MNYERMLISPVVCMSYSIYVNVLQWLSLHCMQLQGIGELGWGVTGVQERHCGRVLVCWRVSC